MRKLKEMKMTFICLLLLSHIANAQIMSPTKVGNGDDGSDLEGFQKITKGKILTTRDEAAKLVAKQNLAAIRGLGNLKVEIEKTSLYMTKKNVSDQQLLDMGAFETDRRGYIYARTFARPLAATRFFPIAESLTDEQLVALHIHEALHRTLPSEINENEDIVSRITLSIVNPETSFDLVSDIVAKYMPKEKLAPSLIAATPFSAATYYLEGDDIQRNIFDYSVNSYSNDESLDKISASHQIESKLYPFGGSMSGVGLGLGLSWVSEDKKSHMGPLKLSLQKQLNTITRFKVYSFIEGSIAAGESEDRNSAYSRDVVRLGLQMYSFKNKNINLINTLKVSLPSKASDSTFSSPTDYEYGSNYNANIKLRGLIKSFGLGAFIDYNIAEERKVKSGNFETLDPRATIVSGGLEAGYYGENFSVFVSSQNLLSASKDVDFGRFGDIDQVGVGNKNVKLGVSLLW